MTTTTVLRRVRIARGLSTVELAAAADISRMTLWRLETGQQAGCHARTSYGLERILGVPFEVLILPDKKNAADPKASGAGVLTTSATTPKES
jgi:transcriptional regulator with XRE-family HTH domain